MRKFIIFAVVFAMLLTTLPAGMVPAFAAPIADTDTTYTVNNILAAATNVFDGSGNSGYNDTKIESVTKWSNWVSGWTGNNDSTSGTTNMNLISTGGMDMIQFYGGAGGTLPATNAYGVGKDFVVIQFYATAGASYDFSLLDNNGTAFATYAQSSAGILPTGASTAFGINAWNRIYVRNVYDATEPTAAKFMATYATASTADGTYTEQYTATTTGSFDGFKTFSVTRTGGSNWWDNVRVGNLKIYAGDFPASNEEATVTVNYVTASGTIAAAVKSDTVFVGTAYVYTAPEYYSDASNNFYKLAAQPDETEVVSGENNIDVEYILLGQFDTTNNLVTNPSFESGMTDWTAADGNALGTTAQSIVNDSSVATDGEYYLKSTQNSWEYYGVAANGSVSRNFATAEAGKTYFMSFDIMVTSPASPPNYVYMGAYTTNALNVDFGGKQSAAVVNTNPIRAPKATTTANEWVTLSTIVTIGDTDGYLAFSANWLHDHGATCFDNFKVYELTEAQADVEVNYYNSTDSSDIVPLSGTPAVTLTAYTSGAATTVSAPVLGAYSITQPSPIVIDGVSYIKDVTQENITSIDVVSPSGGNVINLYYKEAPIIYAQWSGETIKTRVGVIPTIPTEDAVEFWTSDPETASADGTTDLLSFDSESLATLVASVGNKTLNGTIVGYDDSIEIPIEVVESLDFMVAHYEFKDAESPLRDTSGNGYDGAEQSDNAAMSYDSDNGYAIFPGYSAAEARGAAITLPGAVASKMSGDWTYSVWAQRDYTGDSVTQGGKMIIFDVASGDYTRYYFEFNSQSGNHVIRDRGAGANAGQFINATYSTTPYPMRDKWSLVTLTYDAETTTLTEYVDGVVEATNTNQVGSPASYASGTFYIGRNHWSSVSGQVAANPDFKGKMSDIRIYNFALSADEVTELYEGSALSVEVFKNIYVNGTLDATESLGYKNIGDSVSLTPDATYTNAAATYLYDTTAANVTSISVATAAIELYYKTDYVTGAEAVTAQTREGILPTLPETVTATTAGGSTVPNVPVVWNMPEKSAVTTAASPLTVTGTINTGTEGGADVTISASVTVIPLSDYLIADFNFDSSLTDGGAAAATVTGSPTLSSERLYGEGSISLSSGNYLALTKADGSNLLAGQSEITIAYFAKVSGKSWTFFAEPNTSGTVYNAENYVGILDHDGNASSITAEKYLGGRGSANSRALTATGTDTAAWHHTALTIDKNGNAALYVDGVLKQSSTGGATLDTIMGESSLCYLGYATWGSGEYAAALVDDLKIYSTALNADEIAAISVMPSQLAFTVNYNCGGETIATESVTEFEGRVYSIAAGSEIYDMATDAYYSVDSAFSETVTSEMVTIDIAVSKDTSKYPVIADTFVNNASDTNNNNTENNLFIAASGSAIGTDLAPAQDADGVATYSTNTLLGNVRVALVRFNLPTSLENNDAVLMKLYVGSAHPYLAEGTRYAAYVLDGDTWTEDAINAAYTDASFASSQSPIFTREAVAAGGWMTFDVSDAVRAAIAKGDTTIAFKLLGTQGAVYVADREKATIGGAFAGKAAYMEVTEGYALTADTTVSKLTKAGSVASTSTVIPVGDSAKAYFDTAFTDYTADVFVNSAKVATLDETAAKSYDLGVIGAATTVSFTVAEIPQGVTVSGSFTADAGADAAVVTLVPAEGATLAAEVTAADAENRSAAYTFTNVAAGTYTLTISKNAYVTYTKEVTVGAEAVTNDAVVLIGGDLDNSGAVNSSDLSELLAKYGASTTTEGWADFAQYDIDGSGSINSSDLSSLLGSYGKSY